MKLVKEGRQGTQYRKLYEYFVITQQTAFENEYHFLDIVESYIVFDKDDVIPKISSTDIPNDAYKFESYPDAQEFIFKWMPEGDYQIKKYFHLVIISDTADYNL